MTKFVVDEPLSARLAELEDSVEFCDPSGRTLGHFVPVQPFAFRRGASDDCPYTDEELEQMHQEQGGRSLGEIWKSLGRQ